MGTSGWGVSQASAIPFCLDFCVWEGGNKQTFRGEREREREEGNIPDAKCFNKF
jgi:hypothetical protein